MQAAGTISRLCPIIDLHTKQHIMQLKLKLNPRKITARTQVEVLSKIRDRHLFSVGAIGSALTPYPGDRKDHVRVYSLEKRRKKVERHRVAGKMVNGTKLTGKTVSKVISPAQWVGIYYDIPASLLEAAGLKVVQDHRTFVIKNR